MYALRDNAREILIEPQERGTKILYRIGDEWREQMKIPPYVHGPLLQHLKITAGMDVLKLRQIQEGEISSKFQEQQYWLYTRTDPQEFGERATIRIEAFA